MTVEEFQSLSHRLRRVRALGKGYEVKKRRATVHSLVASAARNSSGRLHIPGGSAWKRHLHPSGRSKGSSTDQGMHTPRGNAWKRRLLRRSSVGGSTPSAMETPSISGDTPRRASPVSSTTAPSEWEVTSSRQVSNSRARVRFGNEGTDGGCLVQSRVGMQNGGGAQIGGGMQNGRGYEEGGGYEDGGGRKVRVLRFADGGDSIVQARPAIENGGGDGKSGFKTPPRSARVAPYTPPPSPPSRASQDGDDDDDDEPVVVSKRQTARERLEELRRLKQQRSQTVEGQEGAGHVAARQGPNNPSFVRSFANTRLCKHSNPCKGTQTFGSLPRVLLSACSRSLLMHCML